jgi:formyltetrahydrofolate-dependent phosphoribosylglycinamide formyltransferase
MALIRPISRPLERPIRLGTLISGGGTTLQNFLDRIAAGKLSAEVALVVASDSKCGGIARAKAAGVPCVAVPHAKFASTAAFSAKVFTELRRADVDLVVMAGFLKLIQIPDDFRYRVMNIHPGLIPAFCGKGFYGRRVHAAALERGVKVSGCTIHFADNEYDHGPIIEQRTVPVLEGDTPESLAARVFEAECEAYPHAVELFAAGRLAIDGGRVLVEESRAGGNS